MDTADSMSDHPEVDSRGRPPPKTRLDHIVRWYMGERHHRLWPKPEHSLENAALRILAVVPGSLWGFLMAPVSLPLAVIGVIAIFVAVPFIGRLLLRAMRKAARR